MPRKLEHPSEIKRKKREKAEKIKEAKRAERLKKNPEIRSKAAKESWEKRKETGEFVPKSLKEKLEKQDPKDPEFLKKAAQKKEALLQIQKIDRVLKARQAKDDIIPFAELLMPYPNDPTNPHKSRYKSQQIHKILAKSLMDIESGKNKRLIICLPPRVGKSQISSKFFPPWFVGRKPERSVILVAYNQKVAEGFGKSVRNIMKSNVYHEVFPDCRLEKGSAASGSMVTTGDGELTFSGRDGTITGKGGDVLIIDDLIKNSEEANSQLMRDAVWSFFTSDMMSRMMTDSGAVVIVMTRRHEDDVIGRLTDPQNPHYNEKEAKQWKMINIPALAEEDDDILGRKIGESIWPERFSAEFFETFRNRNPQEFSAAYQQRPSPEDGNEITKDMVQTYRIGGLPKDLRIYIASDHAYSTAKDADFSCYIVAGVCSNNHLWILDCWWKRAKPEVCAEKIASLISEYKPFTWILARDHISATLEPLIILEMKKKNVHCNFVKSSEHLGKGGKGDGKLKKAQSIIGMMGMGMVHFPEYAPWFQNARSELLKFPNGSHDDFVDAISHLGRHLSKTIKPTKTELPVEDTSCTVGSIAWIMKAGKAREDKLKQSSKGGW